MFSISLNNTIHHVLPILIAKPNTFWMYLLFECIHLHCHYSLPGHHHHCLDYCNWQISFLTFNVASSYLFPIHEPPQIWTFCSPFKRLQRLPSDLRMSTSSFTWPFRLSHTWPFSNFQHHLLLFFLSNCVLQPQKTKQNCIPCYVYQLLLSF